MPLTRVEKIVHACLKGRPYILEQIWYNIYNLSDDHFSYIVRVITWRAWMHVE